MTNLQSYLSWLIETQAKISETIYQHQKIYSAADYGYVVYKNENPSCPDLTQETLKVNNKLVQILKSPDYPTFNYPNNIDCSWNLYTNRAKSLNVEFLAFDVEHSHNCQHDFVQLTDSTWENGKSQIYCNPENWETSSVTKFEDFKTAGHKLNIRFKNDDSVVGRGFELKVTSFDNDKRGR